MANPPDFRDLNRQKNSKALEFASFKSKVQKGVGSRVGSGQPPEPPVTPSPTSSSIPVPPTPTPSVTVSLTPTNTPTSSPTALPFSLLGPGTVQGQGVLMSALDRFGFYFGNNLVPNEIPINMEINYNGQVVALIVFDSVRLNTPFKFVIDYTDPASVEHYGNFVSGSVSFSGGPLPTPTVTPTISLTPSISPTPTRSGTPLPTPPLPTPEPTPTVTPPVTPTPNVTPSVSPSITVSSSIQPTQTPTSSRTPTISLTPSITPSMTDGASPTPTPSVTPTLTPSLPFVTSYGPNELVSANPAQQESYFIVNYGTVTGDPSGNFYITVNPNDTLVSVEAFYLDESGVPYGTQFIPLTLVESSITFQLSTFSVVNSAAELEEYYLLVNPSDADQAHWIIPALGDFQVIFRVVAESGDPGTYNWSVDTGAFVDINTTPTPTPTKTPTPTITNSETPPPTPSNTNTPTITPSLTIGATPTPTPTISVTISNSPTITPSMTIGESPTPTPTVTVSPSLTIGTTPTPTATVSPTMTPSVTLTPGHGPVYTAPVSASPSGPSLIQSFYVNLGRDNSNLTLNFNPGGQPTEFVMTIPDDTSVNISTGIINTLSSFETSVYPQDYSAYDLFIMITASTSATPTWTVGVETSPI